MERTVRVFDQQYLVQTTADLLTRRAEIQKLEEAIRAAEASTRSRSARRSSVARPRDPGAGDGQAGARIALAIAS